MRGSSLTIAGIVLWSVIPVATAAPARHGPAAGASHPATPAETLQIVGTIAEIPGTFPPNDLYNYVYVMKYRVIKVLRGGYAGAEILVGHYNPLIPRARIADKMKPFTKGNVEKFEVGALNRLTLVTPVSSVWSGAMEDEYFDSDQTKYYALQADIVK